MWRMGIFKRKREAVHNFLFMFLFILGKKTIFIGNFHKQ